MARQAKLRKLPEGEELSRFQDLVRICETSRQGRKAAYERFRTLYKNGTEKGTKARYNKLKSHIHMVGSFVFSPGTIRFGFHLPPNVRELWLGATTIARDEFRQTWQDAGADTLLKMALQWSLVNGATVVKVQPNPTSQFHLGYINPGDFGVGREDVPDLDEQDTLCHWYTLSIPQITRWLGHEPGHEQLIQACRDRASVKKGGPTRARLVVSGVSGAFPNSTVTAGFPSEPLTDPDLEAEVDEQTVEFVDLWERRLFKRKDDVFEDWLVTTMLAADYTPLAQRRNPDIPATQVSMRDTMPAELPFAILAPRPDPEYFWGDSELANLTTLQDWLEEHIGDLKEMVKRQLKPSKFFSGVADFEEANRAMDTIGGGYASPEPNARMDKIMPQITPESLKMYSMILEMFADSSGIPSSFGDPTAQQAGGVRSSGHFSMAAGIGAGRLRDMALVVEEFLGDVATKGFHITQRHNTVLYRMDDGKPFLLSQIPHTVTLTVDGHSSAPIFSEQTQAKAMLLSKAGALGPEDLVELVDPPGREELKVRAKEMAKGKSEMQGRMLDIKAQQAQKTGKK